ncbi:MAG: peptide ABC transporter substrate-binding protein [Candidatus Dormibacteraceae bacterium]
MHISKLRGLKTLAVATAAFTLALACGNTGGGTTTGTGGTAKPGGKITAASWQEPDSMLSNGITDSLSHAIAITAPMTEGLLGLTNTADIPKGAKIADYFQPQLATEVPTTDNGDVKVTGDKMAVTYKLRHNVTWHDGEKFTSKDVVDTFNFWWLKFKDNNPTPLVSTTGWDQVESVSAADDFTVTVVFKALFGPYLTLGSGPEGVLPSHLLQKTWSDATGKGDMTKTKLAIDNTVSAPTGYKGTDTWDKFVMGTGPFVFKEWISGDHLTMVRNEKYWGSHKAYLDSITVKFEPDTNTQLADLRTGTIDIGVDFRAALLSPLAHVDKVTTVVLPDTGAEHIDLNLKNKYLSDLNIRKAINMAIDKQKMIDTLLEGKSSIPPDSWLCLGLAAWCADPSVPKTKYDPKAAGDLLDGVGYKKQTSGADKGMRAFKDGSTIAVDLSTTTGNALREQQEVQISSDLGFIGIKVNTPFKNYRAGKLFGAFASGGVLYNHTFDMAQYTQTFSAGEPDAAYGGYVCDQIPTQANGGVGQNSTQECNPAVDAAFKAGRGKVSQADRKSSYVDAQKALAADLPDIPLYGQLTVNAFSSKLGGYKGNADIWYNNSVDWFING